MQADDLCENDLEGLDADSIIPVEYLSSDVVTQPSHSQDALSIVELGKQLLLSAKNGDTLLVRDLMCKGAPFTTDWLGTSALHLAAQNNHTDTAEVLLRAGISRDARTKVDRTPLHMAAYEGHNEMAQLLLNYGADVDSRDMLKMTPLHWAVEREHLEVMNVLLEHGADANATSKFDKTPISLALELHRLDLVDVLQQEREMLGVHAQHNQDQPTELDEATNSLMQLETERQERERFEMQQQQQQQQQQYQQQKRKLTQAQASKKQRMIFQQIRMSTASDEEQERDAELIDDLTNAESVSKKHKALADLQQPLRLLEAHGITMIPVENESTIVESAMGSGRTVVLTEAGKLALNLTRSPTVGVKRLQVGSRRGASRKVIAIRADQILGQSTPTLTPRGPNILKRNTSDKSPKMVLTSIGNNTSSPISQTKTPVISPKKKVVGVSANSTKPVVLHLDDEIEEITEEETTEESMELVMDIAVLHRQLQEARREAAEYRKLLLKKEEEAEIYKQQLKNMTMQKNSK